MTTQRQSRVSPAAPMLAAFPTPGEHVRLAYRELHLAVNGTDEQKKALGRHDLLPRPWDPSSCRDPELRYELWEWLDEVVGWLNREHSWDVTGLVPTCWPRHPHLVHELASLADQRRRAGLALNSDALEEWYRYCLPAFVDRMRNRLRAHCDDGHQTWPGKPRHSEHLGEAATQTRETTFASDVDTLTVNPPGDDANQAGRRPRLVRVDVTTGQIMDDDPHDNPHDDPDPDADRRG